MENKNSVIEIVKTFESSSSITTDQIEAITGLRLHEEKHSDALDDFLGDAPPNYKTYSGEGIQKELGVSSLKITETTEESKNAVIYLEIKLHNPLPIDSVKKAWGSDYKLIVNRPTLPIGDRCIAQYLTATTRLDFGFSDCENMDHVIKISATKISNGEF